METFKVNDNKTKILGSDFLMKHAQSSERDERALKKQLEDLSQKDEDGKL